MGLLWRIFAPKPLKKARRALHPGWIIEDAIVNAARGSKKKAAPKPKAETFTASIRVTSEDGQVRLFECQHAHRTPGAADTCGHKMWNAWRKDHPDDKLV